MRCRNCEHTLWNQPAPPAGEPRVCSECGEAYRVDGFRFERGKVRFCCPGCDTGYYGTDASGHLEPARFDCVGCGRTLTMEDCVVRPHDPTHEADAMQRVELPWIASGSDGILRRWFRTATLGLSDAGRIAPMLQRAPQPTRAATFLLINAALATLTAAVPFILVGGLQGVGAAGRLDLLGLVTGFAAYLVVVAAVVALATLPAAAVALGMRVFGAQAEPQGFGRAFARAFEVVCYSSGGLLAGCLPCCGGFVAGIWWMVQCAQAFGQAYAVKGARTSVAAAALSFVGFLAGLAMFVGVIALT